LANTGGAFDNLSGKGSAKRGLPLSGWFAPDGAAPSSGHHLAGGYERGSLIELTNTVPGFRRECGSLIESSCSMHRCSTVAD
jgi:hypothetical protein